jgi:hypothetical protein
VAEDVGCIALSAGSAAGIASFSQCLLLVLACQPDAAACSFHNSSSSAELHLLMR